MPLYDYLSPKLDFKRKFNYRQLFLYKGRLTVQTIRKFRIGSSLRIESRIGSSIRNRIESRSFAGPYSKRLTYLVFTLTAMLVLMLSLSLSLSDQCQKVVTLYLFSVTQKLAGLNFFSWSDCTLLCFILWPV